MPSTPKPFSPRPIPLGAFLKICFWNNALFFGICFFMVSIAAAGPDITSYTPWKFWGETQQIQGEVTSVCRSSIVTRNRTNIYGHAFQGQLSDGTSITGTSYSHDPRSTHDAVTIEYFSKTHAAQIVNEWSSNESLIFVITSILFLLLAMACFVYYIRTNFRLYFTLRAGVGSWASGTKNKNQDEAQEMVSALPESFSAYISPKDRIGAMLGVLILTGALYIEFFVVSRC